MHDRGEKCIQNFRWKTLKGREPVRKPRNRWENNIKMDLKETAYEGVDWIHLAQDREQ
jgi:hypothetical protein